MRWRQCVKLSLSGALKVPGTVLYIVRNGCVVKKNHGFLPLLGMKQGPWDGAGKYIYIYIYIANILENQVSPPPS